MELSGDSLREAPLNVPPIAVQEHIADFLDVETSRIDALVEKKHRMIELLHSRCEALIEESIRGLVENYGAWPLKYAARRIEVGIVITPAAWYAETGVLALRGLNIRPGQIVLDDVVKINEGDSASTRNRHSAPETSWWSGRDRLEPLQ